MRIDEKELVVSIGVLGHRGAGKSSLLHKWGLLG